MPAARPRTRILINGVEVTSPRRPGEVRPSRLLIHNLDGPDQFEFTELRATSQTYPDGSEVIVQVAFDTDADGTLESYVTRFKGRILDAAKSFDGRAGGGLRISYRCDGLVFFADEVRVTHPQSGKSEVSFNLQVDDQDYEADLARLELGDIIRRVLTYDQHATDLWGQGIETYTAAPPYDTAGEVPPILKAATLADLDAMDVVPLNEVRLSGTKLWQQITNIVQDILPYRAPAILPDGTIRFFDTRSPQWQELKLGTDPVSGADLGHDASQAYGAVRIIGNDEVTGETFQLEDGTLVEGWDNGDEEGWTWSDYAISENATSTGTIDELGPISVTVRPTAGVQQWTVNRWSQERAVVELILPLGPNNPSRLVETIPILSNTACSPGGTSVLTLEYAAAATGYTQFRIIGQSTSERQYVYRLYEFADPAKASAVVDRFPFPVAWQLRTGTEFVRVPVGKNYQQGEGSGDPFETDLFFDIVTIGGVRKILTGEPTVRSWTSQANLDTGGDSVTKPTNILVFVPISRGALTVRSPQTGWSGPAATNPYLRRTKYVTLEDWRYKGDQQRVQEYADTLIDVYKDPVIGGSLNYLGLWQQAVETPNLAVKLTSDFGTTPWEAEKLLIRSVEITWPENGSTGHVTRLAVSNQRRPWVGDSQYQPATFEAGGPLADAPELDLRG